MKTNDQSDKSKAKPDVGCSGLLGGWNVQVMPRKECIEPLFCPDGHECSDSCLGEYKSLVSALSHIRERMVLTPQQVAVLTRHERNTRNGLPREFLDWVDRGERSGLPAPEYQLECSFDVFEMAKPPNSYVSCKIVV